MLGLQKNKMLSMYIQSKLYRLFFVFLLYTSSTYNPSLELSLKFTKYFHLSVEEIFKLEGE